MVRNSVNIRTLAVAVVITLTAVGASSCGTPAAPTQPTETHSPTVEPSPTAAAAAPVLSPGESATFSIGSTADSKVMTMTWDMGSKVATEADSSRPGYQDIAFNLTMRNDEAERIDPSVQTSMVWRGTDGRTDDTLAHTAAITITPSAHGLDGEDLALKTGGLPPHGHAKGYIALLVPTSPGAIVVRDPNTYHPVLVINYDKVPNDQLDSFRRE